MTNFKRKKPHLLKDITWATPKGLQKKIDPLVEVRRPYKRKKSKVCKFYKGEHQFKEVSRQYIDCIEETFFEYKCACGKIDILFKKGRHIKIQPT